MSGFVPVQVLERIEWTPGLVTLRLDHPSPDLVPGQFIQLARRDGEHLLKRSYSASSAPGDPIEVFLSEVDQGALSPHLLSLREGDEVLLDPAPLGFFVLAEIPDAQTLWLIATGTGLGPYISMLREGSVLDRFQSVCLVHGVRTRQQLAYRQELQSLVDIRGLIYVPVVSREPPPPDGLDGRVTSALASGELEKRSGRVVNEQAHVMLCGNPSMIEEMANLLKARGLDKHRRRKPGHFTFEKYW